MGTISVTIYVMGIKIMKKNIKKFKIIIITRGMEVIKPIVRSQNRLILVEGSNNFQ